MLVSINGVSKNVENNLTVLQACESFGMTIPHFCYHDKLAIAGNCRMCLVEEVKSLKPLVSCAVSITPSMEIFTNTELVKKAREGVMEFLLANHPLDCPICDQGGECDLQDQALLYGGDQGRFYEEKRAVSDKNCGPLVKTVMTRCIHCTRCVRFMQDIAGFSSMGVTGRGAKMEIGFYIETGIASELSGNIIDLCPVGALTSKPYAFSARSWELQSFESIDFFDAVHSNIRVDVRGTNIMRILPKINQLLNEDWISDKIRFAFDALKYQRLTTPLLKNAFGKLLPVSWELLFLAIKSQFASIYKSNLKYNPITGVSGPFVGVEALNAFKNFLNLSGTSSFFSESLTGVCSTISSDFLSDYKFTFTSSQIEDADLCLFIGSNPKMEAPILNIKFRKLFLNGVNMYTIGFNFFSNFYMKSLGSSLKTLLQILEGNHWFTSKILCAKKPLIIVGSSMFCIPEFQKVLPTLRKMVMRTSWFGFGFLPLSSNCIQAAELGFSPGIHGFLNKQEDTLMYCLGTNFVNLTPNKQDAIPWIIYQGHHGISDLKNVAAILPSASPLEQKDSYVNVFGTVQHSKAIFLGLNNLRSDTEVIRSLTFFLLHNLWAKQSSRRNSCSFFLKKQQQHNKIVVRESSLIDVFSYLSLSNTIHNNFVSFFNIITHSFMHNFYISDNFSCASKTMLLCSKAFYVGTTTYLSS